MKRAVKVLFFAALREQIATKELWVEIEEGFRAMDLVRCLQGVYPQIRDFLPRARIAVNQKMAPLDQDLADGDEVALIPPVSGG